MKKSVVAVGILLGLALWLRWRYVHDISLYVDEFTTLWAARRVQQIGAPIMPSGVLYTRGLLASYIEAAFLTLFGFSYTVGRLPSVLFGLASILASFFIGRRLWNARVGWLAALGLALLPEAIIWSSRARFYAQLQFFALLLVWAAFETIQLPHPPAPSPDLKSKIRSREASGSEAIFAILFVLALFSQEETILLYPTLLLGWVLWRGWRDLFRLRVFLAHGVCVAAMGVRFVLETFGQPGYLETIQAQRPYVGLIFDVRGAWTTYGPLLIAPDRLLWTLGGLLAVVVALMTLRNRQWQLSALSRAQQASLFFALQFLFVLLVILALVGTSWREARYLLLVQPLWFLVGAAGIVWLLDQLVVTALVVLQRPTTKAVTTNLALITTVLLTILIFGISFKSALGVLTQQVEGYDRGLGYLAARKSPPDANEVVMSPQPPACALVLGACAYYAVQRDYAEFVIRRNGVLIDRWTGSTLLNTAAQLQGVLQRDPQPPAPTWFVTDSFRLATRYEPDFVRMVIEQFDLVHQERGVMLLRAGAWRRLPKPVATKQLAQPLLFTPLALTSWERGEAKPGANMPLTLFWKATQTIAQQFNTSARLVAADGKILAQQDGPPARGFIPTNLFFDTPVPDPKMLKIPATLAPGRYRFEVSVYNVPTLTPLTQPQPFAWFTVGPPVAAPQHKIGAVWAKQIQLIGTDVISPILHPGQTLNVRLVWSASAPVDQNYTIFVHLVGADGKPIAQSDRAPEGGFYPTSGWQVGEQVQDNYTLAIPENAPPGQYQLLVGLYRPETGERLLLNNQQDALTLTTLMLVAK